VETVPFLHSELLAGLCEEMLEGLAVHEIICDERGTPYDYRFLVVNPAFERITGFSAYQLVGRTAREIVPGIEEAWIERYGRVALTQESTTFEMKAQSIGATLRVRAFSPQQGYFCAIVSDITDYLEAAKNAELEHDMLVRAEEVSNSGSWRLELDSGEVTWSEGMHRVFGIPKEHFSGDIDGHLSVVHPDDLQMLQATTAQVVASGVPVPIEYRIVRPDGEVRWVRGEAVEETGLNGEVVALSGFYRDITEHRRIEEALEQSENKYATAFMTSADSVVIARMSDGTYLDVNDGFVAATGYDRAEAIGQTSVSLDLWVDLEARDRFIAEVLEHGAADNHETQFRRKDGSVLDGLISGRVIEVLGEPCWLTETRDISALVETKQRLERLLRSITEVMGRVVEVRDPYTKGHEERVAKLARSIAEEMDLPTDEADAVEIAALVHDIGKLSVPIEILNTPGRLTDIEFQIVKGHSTAGYEILKDIEFVWPIADIVLQHHERMDGSGYPGGLAGDDILIAARILAVADVVEAMASHRPYRPAIGIDAAIEEIRANPDKFDAAASAACFRLVERGEIEL